MIAPVLIAAGMPRARAGAFIATAAFFGMVAPPINIAAMIIGSGVDMPYVGFDLPLLIAAVGLVAVYASMYLIWSPVGSPYVLDVQGRYLLPIAPLVVLILPLARRRWVGDTRTAIWLASGSAALLLFALGKSALIFY